MPNPTGTVNFFSPQAMVAPDLAVQQAQNDRAQQLAMALRQMSMEPVDAGKGEVSWTQGAAKLADAIAGRVTQGRVDKQQLGLNQQMAARMGAMFGFNTGGGGPASTPSQAAPPPVAPPVSGIPLSNAPSASPSSSVVPNTLTPVDPDAPPQSASAVAPPDTPLPSGGGQPPSPPAAGASSSPGPMSLTGDPRQDMSMYLMDPEDYMKGVIAARGPTDLAKTMQQARAAMDRGDIGTATALLQNVQKQNYLEPTNVREGGIALDPITHQPIFQSGKSVPGTAIDYQNGQPVGMHALPGASAALGTVEGAQAGARAAAQAPYDLVTVLGPDGNYHQVPKSSLPGVGNYGGAPGGGSLNGYYGHSGAPTTPVSNVSGLGPGQQQATAQAGTNSANEFDNAISAGANAKNAMRTINNIMTAAQGLLTGPGSEAVSEVKSAWNALTPNWAPKADTSNIAHFDEMRKNAASLGDQLSSAASGGGGTDARLKNALDSLPTSRYSPIAIQEVGANLKALQSAALARSQAASAWMQQHGANSYPAFQSAWQQAYNPDIFYYMQKGLPAFQHWVGGMSAPDRARTLDQYRQMKAMGGL